MRGRIGGRNIHYDYCQKKWAFCNELFGGGGGGGINTTA